MRKDDELHLCDAARIKQICKFLRISIKDFATTIGSQPNGIYGITSGNDPLSKNMANRIHRNYPQLSLKWIIDGTGNMIEEPKPERILIPEPVSYADQLIEAQRTIIELKDVNASLREENAILKAKNDTLEKSLAASLDARTDLSVLKKA
jgi:hypothetical protein